jgi:adenylate cyclase
MKKVFVKTGVAFGLALFFTWAYLFTPQVFYSLDNKLRDFMFIVHGELPKSNNIVIVDIDNKSLKELGQWPWSRNTVAQLIDNLTQAHAGIIGLDMVFSEPDKTSPHRLKDTFPEISQQLPNYDARLAKTFSTSPVVGGYMFTAEKTSETRTPLLPAVFIQKGLQNNHYFTEQKGIILNIPILQNALYSSGFFNTNTNEGGVIRSSPLINKYKGDIYTSLAFEMLRIYSGSKKVTIIGDTNGLAFIRFGDFKVPVGSSGEFMINFRGPQKHFPYVSASDIIHNHFDSKMIENKFILIGTSAPGLKDLRYTPFDSVFPGVEVHANIIDNILQGDFIQRPVIARLYDLALIWILIFSLMLIFSFITSWLIVPIAISLFFLMINGLYDLLFQYGIILTLITPIFAFTSTLIVSMAMDYFSASKQKEAAKRMLGKKVSPSVMKHLLAHTKDGLIESKEIESTIFFSDIRGFTTIAEQIGSPKKLIELLNTYMTPMTETIMQHQGTVDKFIGDAIMAYWNAPVAVEDHADKAVSCALEQIQHLKEVNQTIHAKYNVTLSIGIGLHTGVVTAGDMGSEGRSDYTVIGDNVNLASRIEGLTSFYGISILISEETYRQLKKSYLTRPIDTVEVKGKEKSVQLYEVIPNDTLSKEELSNYIQAYTYYQNAQVSDALNLFTALNTFYPCSLYAHYIQRCQTYIDSPELTFSPVLKMTHK